MHANSIGRESLNEQSARAGEDVRLETFPKRTLWFVISSVAGVAESQ